MSLHTQFSLNQRADNQTQVIDCLTLIERPGMDSLLDYLFESDYFTAPASTSFHSVFSGGLVQHSLNVTREFSRENALWQKPIPHDSVIICGLLHDLCKVGAYTETARGYETVKDFPKGHGTLSVARIEEHIKLTQPEKDVILFHMGLFSAYQIKEFTAWDLHKAIIRTPQVQVFAAIDMADSKRKVDDSYRPGV
jgi:23S rRNA maturation-related 3'-5' exoribonuclease YhaM